MLRVARYCRVKVWRGGMLSIINDISIKVIVSEPRSRSVWQFVGAGICQLLIAWNRKRQVCILASPIKTNFLFYGRISKPEIRRYGSVVHNQQGWNRWLTVAFWYSHIWTLNIMFIGVALGETFYGPIKAILSMQGSIHDAVHATSANDVHRCPSFQLTRRAMCHTSHDNPHAIYSSSLGASLFTGSRPQGWRWTKVPYPMLFPVLFLTLRYLNRMHAADLSSAFTTIAAAQQNPVHDFSRCH